MTEEEERKLLTLHMKGMLDVIVTYTNKHMLGLDYCVYVITMCKEFLMDKGEEYVKAPKRDS